jgi:hypothetical protein
MWLSLRQAVFDERLVLPADPVPDGTRFGLSLLVRAPPRGPRSAPALSEALVDGVLCALHAGATADDADKVADRLTGKLGSTPREHLSALARERSVVFSGSPFQLSASRVQLSPCDDLCDAGEVTIQPDPSVSVVLVSGRVTTLKPLAR